MKKILTLIAVSVVAVSLIGCQENQRKKDARATERQQSQYAAGQPLPSFEWSLERHLAIQAYILRNQKVSTHAVWRGQTSIVEGDCPSMGFSLPYDTSLTNPLKPVSNNISASVVEQMEPNGIFLSKNSNATWVFCLNDIGSIDPVLIESDVTTYPYPVSVDYKTNRVVRAGKSSATMSKE